MPKTHFRFLEGFGHCAGWAELGRRLGVSNLEKNYIFEILMKNCSKYVSAIEIRDVAGTPTEHTWAVF